MEGYCNLPAEMAFCAAGLSYYDHPAIPGWRGQLLLATLKDQRLVQLALDAAGTAITARTSFLVGAFGRLRAICVSPEGKVYLGTSNRRGQLSKARQK